jgi:hypothetical protein
MNPRPEYKARVTNDNGLTRGKVPSPLLRSIGARPGDDMIFRRIDPGKAVLRISKKKPVKKRR